MTRRALLALGGAALVGGCGSGGGGDSPDDAQPDRGSAIEGDIALLNSLRDRELESAAAYALAAAQLDGSALRAARTFEGHEQAHAERLAEAIRDLKGELNEPKAPDDHGFPALEDAEQALELAVAVENDAVAAYIDAVPKLSTSELRVLAASVVTVAAEHVAVLLGELERPQVPDAFVLGRKR